MIDLAMADGALTWHCLRWGKFLGDGLIPRQGDDFLNHGFACYNLYATKDGRTMSLGALERQFWKEFCATVGRPDWNIPSYFEPGPHQQELHSHISQLLLSKTLSEWIAPFTDKDCCCEPVLNFDEVMVDSQTRQRQDDGVI